MRMFLGGVERGSQFVQWVMEQVPPLQEAVEADLCVVEAFGEGEAKWGDRVALEAGLAAASRLEAVAMVAGQEEMRKGFRQLVVLIQDVLDGVWEDQECPDVAW